MIEREFIKAELQKLQKILEARADMYIGNDNWNKATNLMSFTIACSGALELLKEQEAVEPQLSMSGMWYECPICHRHLTKDRDNYCARCGKAVKWE